MTFTHALATNNYGPAKFIVDASAANGTHTTIASALTSASSGDTIFIRPGTYTENLTLKAGVNLTAYSCDSSLDGTGHVIISGTCTMTSAGSVTISGIQLQTNGAAALAVTGSAASVVNLFDCYLLFGVTGITFSSSSASAAINMRSCTVDLSTTGIAYFSHSSAGTMIIDYSRLNNNGGSTTASTASAGSLLCFYTRITAPITSSSTSNVEFYHCRIAQTANITLLTLGGSGSQIIDDSYIQNVTGAAPISISSSATITNSTISTGFTSAASGAGTISYAGLNFPSTSALTVTTQTVLNQGPSSTIGSSNSGAANTLTITNSSNTASSTANCAVQVAGGTAADPTHQSIVSGVTTWTWGIDNSASDAWVLAQGTALGTNNVISSSTSGEINYPLQPAFLAYLDTTVSNVTGDGTEYTAIYDTEVFDQNGDFNLGTSTFTAPVTGRYPIDVTASLIGGTSFTGAELIRITTSNRIYRSSMFLNAGSTTVVSGCSSVLADMDAADTFTITLQATDSGGKVDDFAGTSGGQLRNWVSAQLSL